MMPKKLPIDGIDKNDKIVCNTKDDLVCKINEIIGYLQAKEEASKGECRQHSCEYYKCRCILDPNTGYCISKSWHVCNHCNPPEHEERPAKEDDGETWSIWEGFDDRAGTLTRNFGKVGRPANIQDLQEVFVSKEKIKNLATQMGMRSSAKIVQLKTLNRLQIEDIIYDKILESLGLGD